MEETESPTERLEEELREIAQEAKAAWLKWAALMSAVFAVLAAISGLASGHSANEAMLRQIAASDSWNYYQAKGIKSMIAEMQPGEAGAAKVEKYRREQEAIKTEAEEHKAASERALHRHEILSRATTLFQVAIAMTAIAVMTRRRGFLLVSVALGLAGAVFLLQGWWA